MGEAAEIREVDLLVDHHGHQRHLCCDVHQPRGTARGTVLVAHGFKGYKDYGMFPRLAGVLAGAGWATVRFNFAHSGMTRNHQTFERPDLFALDTWNAQVRDLERLVGAVRDGSLLEVDPSAPVVLLGHSRGGLASILAAGRGLPVELVISVAAPADPCRLSEDHRAQLRSGTGVPVQSDRTGQTLLVGPQFLHEITSDPAAHDVLGMAERLGRRLVVVHGLEDRTVGVEDARAIAERAGITPVLVAGADHVFNVTNPHHPEAPPSPELAELEAAVLAALGRVEVVAP
ncbi:MAG: alpha/beta fold hydrolase [Planctomycetota bacterium]|nr:alpha/beta fold hydrolase [Planctomycetota bacterium]